MTPEVALYWMIANNVIYQMEDGEWACGKIGDSAIDMPIGVKLCLDRIHNDLNEKVAQKSETPIATMPTPASGGVEGASTTYPWAGTDRDKGPFLLPKGWMFDD